MKEVYVVVKGKDQNFYSIDKIFDCIEDAEYYVKEYQFYTSEKLWIIPKDDYFKDEFKIDIKYDPLVIAYLNDIEKVVRITLSDHPETGEQRYINSFKFYLKRENNETYENFISRAKTVAKEKQELYLKNKE